MFDGGLSSNYCPSDVFITHLHTDHIANYPWHFDTGVKSGTNFYVPQLTGPRLKNFLEAAHPYQGDNSYIGQESKLTDDYNIIEVEDKKNLEIEIKGKKFILDVIRCYHTVRCTSYGLIEIKKKLKKEYLGLKGQDIKALKYSGVEITESIFNPFFLYIGDTGKEILEHEKDRIVKYSTIMIECTFLDNDELLRADETKHMHWNFLEQIVKDLPQTTFILYHFSSRYKRGYINEYFKKVNLPNIIVWNSN